MIINGDNSASTGLHFAGKSTLVIRNFTFTGAKRDGDNAWIAALYIYFGGNVNDTTNILVENCTFTDNHGSGATFGRMRYLTLRNCTSTNNHGAGIQYEGKGGLLEGITVENNNIDQYTKFGKGGFSFVGWDSIVRNCTTSNNIGAVGFRMDCASERVIVEDVTSTGNDGPGFIFETAIGPTLLKNCLAKENDGPGLQLAAVHNITVDGCWFENNAGGGIVLMEMDRSMPDKCPMCMASDLDQVDHVDKKPMIWNRNTVVKNTTVIATGGQNIYECKNTGDGNSWGCQYDNSYAPNCVYLHDDPAHAGRPEKWLQDEFKGENNTYFHDHRTDVFEVDHHNIFEDLTSWQTLSGSESSSRWEKPSH